ncbi:WxL domain-containing protein [Enterococcus hulanensis]|uniref:WxL domain-containing protein n=1 Tax=Enterococcus TaxID=1350 RepID=UPI000B5AAF1F|nr:MULTISPECIES: WxL domain-containing protein [Enterococcus]MBO0413693.1 WxL domain-containing protein [Enterococcus hulanensis]OTO20818.1 hypothetical protein A5875_002171 [Enterococcus sp. 3H8_DIV0648]
MSKMMKKIVFLLALLFFSVIMIGNPQISQATPFTHNDPAFKMYFEFLDKQGNEIPKPMGMEATHVIAKGIGYGGAGAAPPGTNCPSILVSANPLSITKESGKNTFALNIPEIDLTIQEYDDYYEWLSNMKINTPMPYIRSIEAYVGLGVPSLSKLTQHNFTWYKYTGSSNGINSAYTGASIKFTKQADDTYKIVPHSSYYTPLSLAGYDDIFIGVRTMSNSTNYGKLYSLGREGDRLRFFIIYYQVKEVFEDQTGALIPAPSGYTNEHYVNIIDQPFNYKMTNDSSLPKTYADSGFIYTYEGWYKGAGKKATMDTTHPPSIDFNATLVNDPENEVHVVYNKRALRVVTEDYVDTSGGTIESSWSTSQTLGDGDTFIQTPAATKTDTSGADWEYQGWKLDSEPMSAMRPSTTPVSVLIDANKNIQYVYKKTEHTITEKWVDRSDGTTLVAMTGNPATNSIDDNDHFTGSATATITDSGGGIWDFIGWENVTDDPGNVIASPAYAVNNIKGNKEIRYHYQARNTTATLDLTPTPQVVSSGDNVSWSSRLSNTGTSSLNNLTLKATSNWASGLSHPTQVTITPSSGAPASFTVGAGDWLTGVTLTGVNIPMGQSADITFTDTATGAVNQVLPAEIEITGNMVSPLTAENFVRIDDPDEPNLNPTGNAGLINIPKFEFGEVEVKPFAQTKGLDAASYQAGYNPYIRYKDQESLVGWDLTVKLSQFTSGSKTLPTTTSIKLNNGDLKEVQNYNKDNESLSSVGSIGNKTIFSDGTTVALTNGAAQGVYQLDYAFNDVELDLLAYSGIAGLKYEADLDWTLTTTP